MDYSYDYYGYSGGFEPEFMEIMGEFGLAFLGIAVVLLLVALAVSVVMYVLNSIGFYTIARRRGIRNAWLAWIPVASYWIVGCISDQYQYVVKGRVRSRRKILLILSVVSMVINLVLQTASNAAVVALFMDGSQNGALASGAIGIMSTLMCSGLNIALLVFYYMAMYDLYTSCSPQNNVLYLVMSIIFRVAEPFFVFFNRNKDDGMPPRREATHTHIPQAPVWQPQETPQENKSEPEM